MKFVELIVTTMLKKDVYFADAGYIIGKNINKLMLLDKDLKEIHPKKQYKNYVFNSFYPLEKDKFYKKGRLYIFKIRGLDSEFMKKIHKCLEKLRSEDFKVVSVSESTIEKQHVKELYTITPLIVTVDNKPWLQNNGDLELLKDRIVDNLEKKFKNFFDEEICVKGNFIKNISFKNRVPMSFNYKNIRLLGNKVSIEVQDNEDAQTLAFLARAVGIGEKNSAVGAGFCE